MGAIVVRYKGKEIPKAYLETVLKNCSSYLALASCNDGALIINTFPEEPAVGTITVDAMMAHFEETKEDLKDSTLVYYFGDEPKAEMQPYIIIPNKMIAFVDALTPGFAQDKNTASDVHLFMQEYLVPKIQKVYTFNDNDLDATFKEMAEPILKRDLTSQLNPRGTITFIGSNNHIWTCDKSEISSECDWGFVSNTFGYNESGYPEKAVEPEKPKSMLGSFGKPTAPAASKPTAAPARPIADTAPLDSVVMWAPGATESNGKIKDLYKKVIGTVPPNWKERPQVPVKSSVIKALGLRPVIKDFKEIANNLPKEAHQETKPTAAPAAAPKPTPAPTHPTQVTAATLPVVPPAQIKVAETETIKLIGLEDQHRNEIPDPRKQAELEKGITPFSKLVGIEDLSILRRVRSVDRAAYFGALLKDAPDAFNSLITELLIKAHQVQPGKAAEPTAVQSDDDDADKVILPRKRA